MNDVQKYLLAYRLLGCYEDDSEGWEALQTACDVLWDRMGEAGRDEARRLLA